MKHRPLLQRPLDGRDYLLPSERSWRAVWRTFRVREAVSAVLARLRVSRARALGPRVGWLVLTIIGG
jgi:hypothetical protein